MWLEQGHLDKPVYPLTSAQSLSPANIIHLQVPGIRTQAFWGLLFCQPGSRRSSARSCISNSLWLSHNLLSVPRITTPLLKNLNGKSYSLNAKMLSLAFLSNDWEHLLTNQIKEEKQCVKKTWERCGSGRGNGLSLGGGKHGLEWRSVWQRGTRWLHSQSPSLGAVMWEIYSNSLSSVTWCIKMWILIVFSSLDYGKN